MMDLMDFVVLNVNAKSHYQSNHPTKDFHGILFFFFQFVPKMQMSW